MVGDLSREQLYGERFNYRSIDKNKSINVTIEDSHTYFLCGIYAHTFNDVH